MLRKIILAALLIILIAASACAPISQVLGDAIVTPTAAVPTPSQTATGLNLCTDDIFVSDPVDSLTTTVINHTDWRTLPLVFTFDNGVRAEIVQTTTNEGLGIESYFLSANGTEQGDPQSISDRDLILEEFWADYRGEKITYSVYFLRCGNTVYYYFPPQEPDIQPDQTV